MSEDKAATDTPKSPAAHTKASEPSKLILLKKGPPQKAMFNTAPLRDTLLKQRNTSQATSTYARSQFVLKFWHSAAITLLIGVALVGVSNRKPINRAFSRASEILEATKQFITREANKFYAKKQNPNTNPK
jgi:hypothetical protein